MPRPGRQQQVSPFELGKALLYIGLTGFGGGLSAHYYHQLVDRKKWLSPADFLQGIAICQIVPGPNMGNFAAYAGHRMAGWFGALVGLVAVVGPGVIFVIAVGWFLNQMGDVPAVHDVLRTVAAAAVGVLISAIFRVIPGARGSKGAWPIAIAAFIIVGVLRLPLYWALILLGPIAIWLNRPEPRRG